ncbi:MAG: hemolysin family protein [Spirochaetes bacterium]|nr:hemolysin family protein [Spirochaetota bacterium]
MDYIHLQIAIIFVCLFFSAFFSGSETALFSFKKSELIRFSFSENALENQIAKFLSHPHNILITLLTGNLFVNILLSSLSTSLLLSLWPRYGHIITIAIVTPILILFGEILPKLISLYNYKKLIYYILPLISLIHQIILPVRYILLTISELFIQFFKIRLDGTLDISEDELSIAIYYGEKYGILSGDEKQFISNLLRFTKKTAENAMIHRNKALFIPYNASMHEVINIFKETDVIRAPVFKNNLDTIVGLIDSRELVPYAAGIKKAKTITKLIHPIYHYPASVSLSELLEEFLRNKIQIAIIVDEYGGTLGVVTLKRIIAELFGRGYTLWEDVPKPEIKKEKDVVIVPGDMQIDEFNAMFNVSVNSTESETIGGYIIEKLGYLPKRRASIMVDDYILTVRYVAKNRIQSIEVKREES